MSNLMSYTGAGVVAPAAGTDNSPTFFKALFDHVIAQHNADDAILAAATNAAVGGSVAKRDTNGAANYGGLVVVNPAATQANPAFWSAQNTGFTGSHFAGFVNGVLKFNVDASGNITTVNNITATGTITGSLTGDVAGNATGVKGVAAGRVLLGAGAGAMTALAGTAAGDLVQWDTTLNTGAGGWKAAAFSLGNIAEGSLANSKMASGRVSGAGTLVITMAASVRFDVNGNYIAVPQQTYDYAAHSVPGAAQYRADLATRDLSGALVVTPGVVASDANTALANLPKLTNTLGDPLAIVWLGPNTTAISNTGSSPSSGVGVIVEARDPWAVASIQQAAATNTLLNSTSNASVQAANNGTVTLAPTLAGVTTTAKDLVITGTASLKQQGYINPQTGVAQLSFHTATANTHAASGFPSEQGGTYEGLRTATLRLFDNVEGWYDNCLLDINVTQRGLPLGAITVTNGGSGYASGSPPAVTIAAQSGDPGVGATAVAIVNGSGVVTGINLVDVGYNYIKKPAVTVAPPTSGVTATAAASLQVQARTGMHLKMFGMPDLGAESSAQLNVASGGGNALTAYKISSFRPFAAWPDWSMSPQGAIETATDGGSQAILAGTNGPIGINTTSTTLGVALNTTDTVAFAVTTGFPNPGTDPLPEPLAGTYPSPLFVRLTNASQGAQYTEIVSYTTLAPTSFSGGARNLPGSNVPGGGWNVGTKVELVYVATAVHASAGYGPAQNFLAADPNVFGTGFRHEMYGFVVGSKAQNAEPSNRKFEARMDGSVYSLGAGQSTRTPNVDWTAASPQSVGSAFFAVDPTSATNAGGMFVVGGAGKRFGAIKGALQDGTSNGAGEMVFAVRVNPTDTTLTDQMAVTQTGLRLTNGGATVTKHLTGSTAASLGATLASGAVANVAVTVTGAAAGDECTCACTTSVLAAGVHLSAAVTATNTVTVTVRNDTGGTYTYPSSGNLTFRASIWRH